MRRRRLLALACGVATALVVAALLLVRPRARAMPAAVAPTTPAAPPRTTLGGGGGAPAAALSAPKLTIGGPSEERLRRNLEEYQKVAVYPPWSRAFTEGTKYLLTWNKPSTADLPMDERPGRETTYHFDADRAHVAWGEALTSWIEVWKGDDPHKRVPITVEDAWVVSVNGPRTGRLIQLDYHDDGQDGDAVAGDGRYTNRLVPSALRELAQSNQVQLVAVVSCCDGVRRRFLREFTYAPRRVVEILGMSDAIRDGSLTVTLDVEVLERGVYYFEANLLSGDGATPIGYTQMNYTLASGRQSVDLVFFGRMFSEAGLDGPYLVRDLRGQLLFLDGGEHNLWFTYPTPYRTRAYRRSELSPAAWDAPEKREKIAIMQRLLADTAAGRIGGPTNAPEHIDIDEHGVAHVVQDPPRAPPP